MFETRTSLPDSAYRRFGIQPPLHDSRMYIFPYISETEMMMPSFNLSLFPRKMSAIHETVSYMNQYI